MLIPSAIVIFITLYNINSIVTYKNTTENCHLPATIDDKNTSFKVGNFSNNAGVSKISTAPSINLKEVMNSCNESFRTTFEYLNTLNTTGKFPDETDKTPMCFIRCVYEKVGLIKDDILNKENIVKLLWPATGDSVEICQEEGKTEINPCLKTYLKARCLMLRAIVDGKTSI